MAISSELQFLPKIQKIEKLILAVGGEFLYHNISHVNFGGEVLQFIFPSLNDLEIKGNVFGPAINQLLPSFSMCFLKLKTLRLNRLKIVPNDIFVQLSKLDFLEILEIISINRNDCEWTDDKFIKPCKSQRGGEGEYHKKGDGDVVPELVPAITAFKNLTKLFIKDCLNLTDICIVQGICLSETLKEVEISGLSCVLLISNLHKKV